MEVCPWWALWPGAPALWAAWQARLGRTGPFLLPPHPGSESLSSCRGRWPCLSFSALRSSIYEVS